MSSPLSKELRSKHSVRRPPTISAERLIELRQERTLTRFPDSIIAD